MSKGDSIATDINKVRDLAKQLASIGEKVSDLWMIMTLLRSLPESYQTLVVTLGTKEPSAFDDGDGNCTVTIRRIASLRERFNVGGDTIDDE